MDTRGGAEQQLQGSSSEVLSLGEDKNVTQTATDGNGPSSPAVASAAPTGLSDLTLTDFEQLIYANALAKRPKEAEQAFELMEVHYSSILLLEIYLTAKNHYYVRNIMLHQVLELSII